MKTFFRILVVLATVCSLLMAMLEVIIALPIAPAVINDPCYTQSILYKCTLVIPVAASLLYEVLFYPVMRCQLSILRRIGCCLFCSVLVSLALLVYTLLYTFGPAGVQQHLKAHYWISYSFNVVVLFIIGYVLLTSLLEFVYSQSPEHMKGFLIGAVLCAVSIALLILSLLRQHFIRRSRHMKYIGVYLAASVTVFSALVFAVYCCVARWYKRRERDEPCNERAIIEEIYGRYVEHNSIEETDTT